MCLALVGWRDLHLTCCFSGDLNLAARPSQQQVKDGEPGRDCRRASAWAGGDGDQHALVRVSEEVDDIAQCGCEPCQGLFFTDTGIGEA